MKIDMEINIRASQLCTNSFAFQNEKIKQEFAISRQQHQSCLEEVT